jgi:hypothetical protein
LLRRIYRRPQRKRKLADMTRIARLLLLASLAAGFALPAGAQTLRYPVKKAMDFDIWCTEVQHIAWERCDKRLPEDIKTFEAYRAVVERYEIPYLKEKESALRFDEDILHNDPIDKRPDSTIQQPPSATADRP